MKIMIIACLKNELQKRNMRRKAFLRFIRGVGSVMNYFKKDMRPYKRMKNRYSTDTFTWQLFYTRCCSRVR